ncbi:MAG: hypothetical protein WA667_10590 [Candidatus Nitrosopolaris sp.]
MSEKLNRTITLKFRYLSNASVLIDRLKNYVEEAPCCAVRALHELGKSDDAMKCFDTALEDRC